MKIQRSGVYAVYIIVLCSYKPSFLNARVIKIPKPSQDTGKQANHVHSIWAWGRVVGLTHHWRRSKTPTKDWPQAIYFPLAKHSDFLLITDLSEHLCVSHLSTRLPLSPPYTPFPWLSDFLLTPTPTESL